jgi:choloylglycine hydrolase
MQKYYRIIYAIGLFSLSLQGCTEFRITADDKSVIIGRSMEWGDDMHTRIVVQPRGKQFFSSAPDGSRGLTWQSKYGFLFTDAYGLDAATDGMNEQGLSLGALFFPGFGKFQTIPEGQQKKALTSIDFAFWILGNFATIQEVRQALEQVYVWEAPVNLPQAKNALLPFHFGIYDASGKGIVVEYTKDGLKVFDNEVGVLTNAPTYDWHIINLSNYIGLSSLQPKAIKIGALELAPLGQGIGLRGIPGDFTPPSRFVRAAAMKHFADPAKNALDAVTLANHVLYTVDIPLGTIKDTQQQGKHEDYAQWVVIKDLTNKQLYFRSYFNATLRKIDLNKIDFSPKASRVAIAVEDGAPSFIDVTDKLKALP